MTLCFPHPSAIVDLAGPQAGRAAESRTREDPGRTIRESPLRATDPLTLVHRSEGPRCH